MLGDNGGLHNPLIRPNISWGGGGIGGAPSKKNMTMTVGSFSKGANHRTNYKSQPEEAYKKARQNLPCSITISRKPEAF